MRAAVLLELNTDRTLKRLVEQVGSYAALIDEHKKLFTKLYGTRCFLVAGGISLDVSAASAFGHRVVAGAPR